MPWFLALPGHQQLWYWLCRINRSCAIHEGFQLPVPLKWKMIENVNNFFMSPKNRFSTIWVKIAPVFSLVHVHTYNSLRHIGMVLSWIIKCSWCMHTAGGCTCKMSKPKMQKNQLTHCGPVWPSEVIHDDMETVFMWLALCEGNLLLKGGFPSPWKNQ